MKLKPCPFCGSEIKMAFSYANTLPACKYVTSASVFCQNRDCFLQIGSDRTAMPKDVFYNAWNTRADEPAEEKTAHWDINCDGYYPFCSHCGEAAERMTPHCPNCGRKMITRRHEDT